MRDAGGIGNPFSHLILRQAQFELGDLDRAKENLALAYMGGGKEIFEGDDPKYYEYLINSLDLFMQEKNNVLPANIYVIKALFEREFQF